LRIALPAQIEYAFSQRRIPDIAEVLFAFLTVDFHFNLLSALKVGCTAAQVALSRKNMVSYPKLKHLGFPFHRLYKPAAGGGLSVPCVTGPRRWDGPVVQAVSAAVVILFSFSGMPDGGGQQYAPIHFLPHTVETSVNNHLRTLHV
jgi:hypothetical protein